MQPDPENFTDFDELSEEDFTFLFGSALARGSIDEAYKQQKYRYYKSHGVDQVAVVAQSPLDHHPYAIVWLPDGWIGTGGGAKADWSGAGSLLTMSKGTRSSSTFGWEAMSKDHSAPEEVVLYVWAIGIRIS